MTPKRKASASFFCEAQPIRISGCPKPFKINSFSYGRRAGFFAFNRMKRLADFPHYLNETPFV